MKKMVLGALVFLSFAAFASKNPDLVAKGLRFVAPAVTDKAPSTLLKKGKSSINPATNNSTVMMALTGINSLRESPYYQQELFCPMEAPQLLLVSLWPMELLT